jgi:signal peptidase I
MNRRSFLLTLGAIGSAVAPRPSRAASLADWFEDFRVARRFVDAGIPIHSYVTKSTSMLPTMAIDDVVLADLRSRGAPPARGELIVFRNSDGADWMKRAVGLPGDRIAFKNWRLILNGAEVACDSAGQGEFATPTGRRTLPLWRESPPDARPYQIVIEDDLPKSWRRLADLPEIEVPPGRVYVLGDNRTNSADSRTSMIGTIAISDIVGRVVYRLRPNAGWMVPEQSVPGLPPK